MDRAEAHFQTTGVRIGESVAYMDPRLFDWAGQDLYEVIAALLFGGSPDNVIRADRYAAKRRLLETMQLATRSESEPLPLTFAALQTANRERGKAWGKGLDIPYLFNAVELAGECGELMNEIKKHYRHEIGIAGGERSRLPEIIDELGDVVICCSLLANKLGIDLGQAVAAKFNKTSEKHGFPHRLAA